MFACLVLISIPNSFCAESDDNQQYVSCNNPFECVNVRTSLPPRRFTVPPRKFLVPSRRLVDRRALQEQIPGPGGVAGLAVLIGIVAIVIVVIALIIFCCLRGACSIIWCCLKSACSIIWCCLKSACSIIWCCLKSACSIIWCCLKRACSIICCCLRRRRRRGSNNSQVRRRIDANLDDFYADKILRSYGSIAPRRYTYAEVKKLTTSFKDKVGQGGFGVVYKGTLDDGRDVAVKVLNETKGNGEEFINEVVSISRTSHVNIVALLGFCYEKTKNKRALIYEFVSNGSLDRFLNNKGSSNTNCHLDIRALFRIAVGVARGLEYLHRGCRTRILHFDIKPHNILLDEHLCPKISDFGLAKICKTNESIVSMTGMKGTIGYIAPEVVNRCLGGVSHKSDVYSYGMLILAMVGGRREEFPDGTSQSSENYFPNYIYTKLERRSEGLHRFGEITREEEDTIHKMITVSLWCILANPSDRPSMSKVIEMLEGSLQSLQLPPKPSSVSPPRSPQESSNSESIPL
ncbi:hypothetical protein CJ030_MR6G021587 [Morella rubra]|uniref:non-specific serine/threonine protein kinase n=1 Tax=Morella rubra TaxID=262757 RepID=A0A6A1VEQ5_9ROSI|nr:hypothetical protein CJ030_MR6G021587 [Morella rubra]